MAIRAHAEGHAAFVERLGDLVAGLLASAAIEHTRREMAQSKKRVGIVDTPRLDANLDGDGGNRVRLFRDDDKAVAQHVARGVEPLAKRRRHLPEPSTGLNQPIVRRSLRRYFSATRLTSLCVTPAMRAGASLIDLHVCHSLKISKLVTDIRHAVVLEHEPGAELVLCLRNLPVGYTVPGHIVQRLARSRLDVAKGYAVDRGRRDQVEKRVLRRQQPRPDIRRQLTFDKGSVQPGAPLRRRRAEARPQVDAFGTGQNGVEHQHGEEIRIGNGRSVIRKLQISRRSLSRNLDAALTELLWLDSAHPLWCAGSGDGAELFFHATEDVIGVDVADDDDGRVVGNIVTPVVLVQIVTRHRLQIRKPADCRVPIRMHLICGRDDLLFK